MAIQVPTQHLAIVTGRSQAGHFAPDDASGIAGKELLRAVRLDRSDSFAVFAKVLSGVIGTHISKPYVIALEQGIRPITAEIERALWRLAAIQDSADPEIIHASKVIIRTTHNVQVGAIIGADSKPCARPGCAENFVPTNPAQRYHSAYCREEYAKERGRR